MGRWLDPRPGLYADAVALDRSGDLPAAARAYRTLSPLWPAHRPVIRYNLASVLLRQGRDRRAAGLFRGLADETSNAPAVRAGAHFHLGRLAEAAGTTRAARDHYRAALVVEPRHAAARARLAALRAMSDGAAGAPLPCVRERIPRRPANEAPILVYQMGKVASNSVYSGLRAALPQVEIAHSHLLHPASFAHYERWFAGDPDLPPDLVASTRAQIAAGDALRRRLDAGGARWRVVTLTREPIAHLVSVLFHHLAIYARLADAGWPPRREALHAFAVESLRRWAARPDAVDPEPARAALTLALRWFDDEPRRVLGLDLYATPFPHARGYARHHTRRAEVVVVRVEDLSWAAAEAMRALCGIEAFPLPSENRAAARGSGRLYADYLAHCRFPRDLVVAIYATRYATHVYRTAEREALIERWAAGVR